MDVVKTLIVLYVVEIIDRSTPLQPNKTRVTTLPTKPAKPKRKSHPVVVPKQAEEARREEMVAYCWALFCEENSLREIALKASERFNNKVSHMLVQRLVESKLAELAATSKQLAQQWVTKTLALNARLKRSWFAKALHETEFAIVRMEKVSGGAAGGMMVEVIDEKAFAERAVAVDKILKIMEQERRILGVGLATTAPEADAQTVNILQMNTIIMQALAQQTKPGGKLGAQLVIDAGDPEVNGI